MLKRSLVWSPLSWERCPQQQPRILSSSFSCWLVWKLLEPCKRTFFVNSIMKLGGCHGNIKFWILLLQEKKPPSWKTWVSRKKPIQAKWYCVWSFKDKLGEVLFALNLFLSLLLNMKNTGFSKLRLKSILNQFKWPQTTNHRTPSSL